MEHTETTFERHCELVSNMFKKTKMDILGMIKWCLEFVVDKKALDSMVSWY